MLNITYAPADAALAARLQNELSTALGDDFRTPMLVAVLSPGALKDRRVEDAIVQALDAGQHVVPVLTAPTPLPKLIDHLDAVDFSKGYDLDTLVAHIRAAAAGRVMRVLTPTVRASNRTAAYVILVLVVGMFVVAVLMVGGGVIEFPKEEYDQIDTQIAGTENAYIAVNLPHSTEDALNFPATVQAAPTGQRPSLMATATALAKPNK